MKTWTKTTMMAEFTKSSVLRATVTQWDSTTPCTLAICGTQASLVPGQEEEAESSCWSKWKRMWTDGVDDGRETSSLEVWFR